MLNAARMRMFLLLIGFFAIQPLVEAQGTKADYERADRLRELTRDKVFRRWVTANWSEDGNRFWYRIQTDVDAFEFVVVDAVQGRKELAFDHAAVAVALGAATNETLKASKLPFEKITLSDDASQVEFSHAKKLWRVDRKSNTLTAIGDAPPAETKPNEQRGRRSRENDESKWDRRDARSPDGKWVAFVREHQLWVKPFIPDANRKEVVLSDDGKDGDTYNGSPFYWSPDSRHLGVLRWKRGQTHTVHFVESSPKDQVQPKLHSHDYLKPGDEIPQAKLHLFDVDAARQISVSDALFSNPWLDEPRVEWLPDSTRCLFTYNQRGHQVMRVLSVDATSGAVTAVVNEEPKTFFDYAGKQFLKVLPETDELIWMSERDGWNHLYLMDSQTGAVKNQITRGEWVVRKVESVDVEARQIWFRAGGIHPDQDPYHIHFCRVNFDGSGLTKLTSGDGTYAVEYSPDQRFLIGIYSRVELPNVCELRRVSDGSLVCELERSDAARLNATGIKPLERFVAKGRDGKTDIHGVIARPTNFDTAKRYPVIEYIYAGPHSAFVPKAFADYHHYLQGMAELGFIVVQIDGMGTSHRSKAFHDVCWKNLGDSGFPDRIAWIKAAAEKYPQMDLSRVGIYGGSAGGQSSTRAVLVHGDFYKVAVSDCGCHDNRMDKIWWNELWMSWPVGAHYVEQSNVTQAHQLQGKLMLVVGELDRNVDPASTMQVANALIKADKDFDLLVIPGAGHGSAETPYGQRRRKDFFVRHLLGIEPRQ